MGYENFAEILAKNPHVGVVNLKHIVTPLCKLPHGCREKRKKIMSLKFV